MLINTGANIDTQDEMYSNALEEALREGYEKVVQILIDTRADVNAQGG